MVFLTGRNLGRKWTRGRSNERSRSVESRHSKWGQGSLEKEFEIWNDISWHTLFKYVDSLIEYILEVLCTAPYLLQPWFLNGAKIRLWLGVMSPSAKDATDGVKKWFSKISKQAVFHCDCVVSMYKN